MEHGMKAIAGVALAIGLCATSNAVTLTYSGADLLSQSNVSFPSVAPNVVGSSLFFAAPISGDFGKIVSIYPDPSVDASYSFVLNFTRAAGWQDPNSPPNPSNDYDHDLHMVLSDGTNMVGAIYADNTGGTIGGVTFLDGQSSQVDGRVFTSAVTETGFPEIGQTFDYALDFWLAAGSTTVTARLYDSATTVVETSRALNPSAQLSLALVSDESYTQYQLNSVTFVSHSVPAPGTLALLGLGLAGLGFTRRRKAT